MNKDSKLPAEAYGNVAVSRSPTPISDKASNSGDKYQLYTVSCKFERGTALLRDILEKVYNQPSDCMCEVSDETLMLHENIRQALEVTK